MNVTAIIPIKNGEQFILDSTRAVLENMRSTDEIIYINDNSTDRSLNMLREISKREKNIRVINNPGSGIVDALNFGIANSRNNWIARFDIDDLYSKERIEKQRKLISEGVAAIFCDYMFIDENLS